MRDVLGIIKRVHRFGFQERGWNLWLDADHSTWSKAGGIRARSRRYGRLQLKPQAWERRYRMDNLRAVAQVIGRAASRSESAT